MCDRSDEVRATILAALTPSGGSRPPCETVTWAQLATIRTMGDPGPAPFDEILTGMRSMRRDANPVEVFRAHDLAGLTGLEEATLRFGGRVWHPYLLVQAPRLQRLWFEAPRLRQMGQGLAGSMTLPALTHLALDAHALPDLPAGWLPALPALTHLALDARALRDLSAGWLPALPTLTHLDVEGDLRDLSAGWLPDLPALTHLTLDLAGGSIYTERTGWIEVGMERVPAGWRPPLPDLPALTHLTLNLNARLYLLPVGWLPDLPALTHLTLDVEHLSGLPAGWLPDLPALTRLTLAADHLSALSAGWLPDLPALTHLSLQTQSMDYLPVLPDLPALTHLILNLDDSRGYPQLSYYNQSHPPDGWLPPNLTHLELSNLGGMQLDWLPLLPHLTHLTVVGPNVGRLPADWALRLPALTNMMHMAPLYGISTRSYPFLPHLTHLTVELWKMSELLSNWLPSADWRPPLPALTHLTLLQMDQLQTLSAGWLPPLPVLTHLTLQTSQLQYLATDRLPDLPALTHLVLDISGDGDTARFIESAKEDDGYGHVESIISPDKLGDLSTFSSDFLVPVPALTHLTLDAGVLTALPPDFLVPVPALTHLTLDANGLTALPPDFLAVVPALTHLTLDANGLTALPPDFLAVAPALTHLTLDANGLTALPPDFLAVAPALTHLTLDANGLTALPPDFLAASSALTRLTLYTDGLTALPPDFLAAAPALTDLTLDADGLTALPPDFLAAAPRLVDLSLWSACLLGLPPNFLRDAPYPITLDWEGGLRWTLPTEDHLWERLWNLRRGPFVSVSATADAVNVWDHPSRAQGQVVGQVTERYAFPVIQRHIDETGQMWLELSKPGPPDGHQPYVALPLDRMFHETEEIWIATDYVDLLPSVGRECRLEQGP